MSSKLLSSLTSIKHKLLRLVSCLPIDILKKAEKEESIKEGNKPKQYTSSKEFVLVQPDIYRKVHKCESSIKRHKIDECFVVNRLHEVETEWKRLSVNSLCYVGRIDEISQDTRGGGEIRRKCSLSFSPITRWI